MNETLFKIIQVILLLLRLFRIIYIPKSLPKIINNKNIDNLNDNKYLTLCTWNIQCLFYYMNNKIEKLNNIINQIKLINTDIFFLQEVFDDFSKKYIIDNLNEIYPNYLLGTSNKKYIFGEDCGLLVLSKYTIEYLNEFILDYGKLPDCFSNKSALFLKIKNIIFCNTHLQSSEWSIQDNVVKLQIEQIFNYYNDIILVGDLNTDYVYNLINTNNINNNITNIDENKVLDYIISKDDYYNIISNTLYIDISKTSDHYPVMGYIIL